MSQAQQQFEFIEYQKQIVKSAHLIYKRYKVAKGGIDIHLILVGLTLTGLVEKHIDKVVDSIDQFEIVKAKVA